jgi:hypothetical protein
MRGILVVVTPLARHVKPRLPVAQQLVRDRHQVLFQGADIVPLRWKAGGLQLLPLIGNANYDYHRVGGFTRRLWTTASPHGSGLTRRRIQEFAVKAIGGAL